MTTHDPYRLLFRLEGPTTRRVRHHRVVQQHWKITKPTATLRVSPGGQPVRVGNRRLAAPGQHRADG